MLSLPDAKSPKAVQTLFEELLLSNESVKGNYLINICIYNKIIIIIFNNFILLLDWVNFYRQDYIIASLNQSMSKISNNIWQVAPNNTNAAEAAHAMSNREGKHLKLLTAIIR